MSLQDFLTTLVKEKLAGASLGEAQVADMIATLTDRLNKFITLNILTELATKDQELLVKFQALTRGNTKPEVLQEFIQKEIPDGAPFLAKILSDFRQLYLPNLPH
ncbi:MAG: hypothetical protein Q8L37_00250 [Candidatus Gottesmanbacteria bacterium]|nr:hypothetical protein [Candidatus Gottesmanbacteria bacterium]